MADERIRKHIARLAAQMMYDRLETEYFTAKRKAAAQLGIDHRYRPRDLPSNREIRDQVQYFASFYEGEQRAKDIRKMRLAALRLMRRLECFSPKLIGSVWTGHVRKGSDIDIHVFTANLSSVTDILEELGLRYDVQQKRIVKHAVERTFTHVHIFDQFQYELTVYPPDKLRYTFKSSITGQAIEKGSTKELECLLRAESPNDLDAELEPIDQAGVDRFAIFQMLLFPLEEVKQSREHHPEGDALYHSLQVFELARNERPYDIEFLEAALLHDVGKAIDRADHVGAALESLQGFITERTEFLIAHHMDALAYQDRTLGKNARRRLEQSEHLEDLLLLRSLDSAGRIPGAQVCEISEALDYLRTLEEECEADDAWS